MAMQKRAAAATQYYQDNYGLPRHQAAGLVGNFVQESSMNTAARNPGDGRDGTDSIGVAQWNSQRARNLHAFAEGTGRDVGNLQTQLDFAAHEMGFGKPEWDKLPGRGSEAAAGRALRGAQNVREATAAAIGFERPQGWSSARPERGHGWGNRYRHANTLAGGAQVADAGSVSDISDGPVAASPAPRRPSVRDSFRAGNVSAPVAPSLGETGGGLEFPSLPQPSPNNSMAANMVLGIPGTVQSAMEQSPFGMANELGQSTRRAARDFFITPENQLPGPTAADARMAEQESVMTQNLAQLLTGGGVMGGSVPGIAAPQGQSFSLGVGPAPVPDPFMQTPFQSGPAPEMLPPPDMPLQIGPDYGPIREGREALGPQIVQPFEAPMAPELQMGAPMAHVQGPDYSQALDLFAQAAPQPTMTDGMRRENALNTLSSALAAGANTSGWGGWGAAFGGAAAGLSEANQNTFERELQMKANDEQARRSYALQGAELQGSMAESRAATARTNAEIDFRNSEAAARTGNANADRRYEVMAGNESNRFTAGQQNDQSRRDFALQGLDLDRQIIEGDTARTNANAQTARGNEANRVETANVNRRNAFDVSERNAERAFTVGQQNAQNLYNTEVARQQLKAPQVTQTKDAFVIQRLDEDGNYTYDVKPFGQSTAYSPEQLEYMAKLRGEFGETSPLYGIQRYSMLMGAGNVEGIKYAIAEDAQRGGYLEALVPEGLPEINTQVDNILQDKGVYPGTKEYADQSALIYNQIVAQKLNLSDPQVLARAAQAGNVGATLLLRAAGVGQGAQ